MAKRENLVRMLSTKGSSFGRSDVEFLLNVQYGRPCDYRSVTPNVDTRLDYIIESMTRYQQLDLSRYNSAVLFLQYPLEKPLDELSLASFKQGVCEWLGYTDIRFGSIRVETEASDVKNTPPNEMPDRGHTASQIFRGFEDFGTLSDISPNPFLGTSLMHFFDTNA